MEEVAFYVAENGNPVIALRILADLEQRCQSLDELAERGNRPKELLAIGITKYRELHYKPYRILYEVRDGDVLVHGVFDGRRNMSALLQQRLPR